MLYQYFIAYFDNSGYIREHPCSKAIHEIFRGMGDNVYNYSQVVRK